MDVIKYKREGRMHIPVALWGDDYCKANFGRPCILDACQRAGLILPHDTDFFKAVCCSFYPTKNLGGLGDSGAVLTNDFEIADQIRMLRRQGELIRAYSVKRVGHSRMSEVDAAVLRVKLPHLKSWTAIRQNIMARYFDVIKEIAGVRCLYQREGPHNGHVCPVYVTGDRSLFIDHMLEFGIETSIHYPVPIHRMPAAPPTWGCRVGDYPQAEDLAAHEVSLPCYPEMREDEITRVCDALREWRG
jgi:dTDP-4-amino-4,6-dideoxygalactose transaminase